MRPLLVAALVAVPATAAAHIELTNPEPRTLELKQPSCGLTGSTRSANPTVYAPGETITVTWDETINHPGHYRISFDLEGEDFTIPPDFDDTSLDENVLFDMIPDGTGSKQITFPDQECETCTLQVIQMMTDKPPYGDGNDIYFQCADIALRAGTDPIDPVDDGTGCASVVPFFYWPIRKRRKRQARAFQASSSCVASGSQ